MIDPILLHVLGIGLCCFVGGWMHGAHVSGQSMLRRLREFDERVWRSFVRVQTGRNPPEE